MDRDLADRLLRDVFAIAARAGEAILDVYAGTVTPRYKADRSPVTEADHRAHDEIAAALQSLPVEFAAVDVLPDPRIRQELSSLSNWPTIPQLFVRGELVGGADIVAEMYESGQLAEVLGVEGSGGPAPEGEAPAEAPPLQIENRLG